MIQYDEGNQTEIRYKCRRTHTTIINTVRMVTRLTRDDRRNGYIVRDVLDALFHPQPLPRRRKIMVPSPRRKHLDRLSELFLESAQSKLVRCTIDETIDNQTRILDRDGNVWFTIGYLVGGLTQVAKNRAKECDIMLATYQELQEGTNVPRADTIVFSVPWSSDVEQSIGRILRVHPEKNTPMALYYVDPFSMFDAIARKVERFFHTEQYQVTRETASRH